MADSRGLSVKLSIESNNDVFALVFVGDWTRLTGECCLFSIADGIIFWETFFIYERLNIKVVTLAISIRFTHVLELVVMLL